MLPWFWRSNQEYHFDFSCWSTVQVLSSSLLFQLRIYNLHRKHSIDDEFCDITLIFWNKFEFLNCIAAYFLKPSMQFNDCTFDFIAIEADQLILICRGYDCFACVDRLCLQSSSLARSLPRFSGQVCLALPHSVSTGRSMGSRHEHILDFSNQGCFVLVEQV